MFIESILRHHLKRIRRAELFELRVLTNVVYLFVAVLPALATVAAAAFFTDVVLRRVEPGVGASFVVSGWLLHLGGALALVTPLIKRQVHLATSPYLILPVDRSRLAAAVLCTSFMNLGNGCVSLFLAVFWVKNVASSAAPADALAWGAAVVLLLAAAHLAAVLLRVLLWRSMVLYLALLVAGGALLVLGPPASALSTASAALFGGLLAGEHVLVLVPVVCTAVLFLSALRVTRHSMYLDHGTRRGGSSWSGSSWRVPVEMPTRLRRLADGRGASDLLRLQVRILVRNKRARFLAINVLTITLLGLLMLLLALRTENAMFLAIGTVVLVNATGVSYTAHANRLLSTFYDGLSAWPIAPREVVSAIVRLSHASSVAALPPLLVLAHLAPGGGLELVAALWLYGVGVANHAFAFVALRERTRYDLSLGAFDTKGAVVTHPLLNNVCALATSALPLLLVFLAPDPSGLYVCGPLAAAGAAGLVCGRYWITRLAEHLEANRYEMLEGFRRV